MIAKLDAEIRALQDALMTLEREVGEKRRTLSDLIRRRNALLVKAVTPTTGVQDDRERDATV